MAFLNPAVMHEWEDSLARRHIQFYGTKAEVIDIITHPVGFSTAVRILKMTFVFTKILPRPDHLLCRGEFYSQTG